MAADASQMMDGGKYPTSSSVLKVIKSVDPATKIIVPIAYCGWSCYSTTNSFQATVMRGRAAMLKDLTKRWILELEAHLLDFYFIASIPDSCFKDFKFLQSKNSKKNILPAEWLAKATNCFKVEFDCLWSIEGVELGEAIIAEDIGLT